MTRTIKEKPEQSSPDGCNSPAGLFFHIHRMHLESGVLRNYNGTQSLKYLLMRINRDLGEYDDGNAIGKSE